MFCGYSFGDEHLNAMVFDAAERFPRNHFVCLFYDEAPEDLVNRAERRPNLTVAGKKAYVSGGIRAEFSPEDGPILNVSDGANLLLGDFKHFAPFLRGHDRFRDDG